MLPESEAIDAAEPHLIEEAEALDDIRENVAPGLGPVACWSEDPQAIAQSLLSQLAVLRSGLGEGIVPLAAQ